MRIGMLTGEGDDTVYNLTVPEIEQALIIPRTPVLPCQTVSAPRSLDTQCSAAGTPVSACTGCSDLL
eukprot:621033-Hanusia_phi.AAC.1